VADMKTLTTNNRSASIFKSLGSSHIASI